MFKANDWFESLPREKQLYYLEHKSELIEKVSELAHRTEQIRQLENTVEMLEIFIQRYSLKTITPDKLFEYMQEFSNILSFEQIPKLKEQLKND